MQGWLTVGSQLFAWEEHEVVVVTIAVLTLHLAQSRCSHCRPSWWTRSRSLPAIFKHSWAHSAL